MKKDPGPDALYRVYRVADDKPAYLPVPGKVGVTLEDAERLSGGLAAETYIKKVWERPEE